jgi:hypothetical protein
MLAEISCFGIILLRIKAIEDALRAVYDDKRVKDLPDDVREIFVKLGEMLYVP